MMKEIKFLLVSFINIMEKVVKVMLGDLMLLIVALIIGFFYDPAVKRQSTSCITINDNIVSISQNDNIIKDDTAILIKDKLLKIYNSDIDNKREKIISLLIELDRLEETDIFFESNDYIRSYIFNTA